MIHNKMLSCSYTAAVAVIAVATLYPISHVSTVNAEGVSDWFCLTPGFPGHPSPVCDPLNNKCCTGLYCLVDPNDSGGKIHTCQVSPSDWSSSHPQQQGQGQTKGKNTTGVESTSTEINTSMESVKVAALLSLRASDQALDILNNLQRSYQMVIDELADVDNIEQQQSNQVSATYTENLDALGKAAIITVENKKRSSKSKSDKDKQGEDKFDWSQYAPNQQGKDDKKKNSGNGNSNGDYSQYYKGQSGNHRGYVNNVANTPGSNDAKDEEIKNLLSEANQDLQQATELMKEKILNDAKDTKDNTMTTAQSKMLETAHGLITAAMQLLQRISESLDNAGSNSENKDGQGTQSPAHHHMSYYSGANGERQPPQLVQIHEQTMNALKSTEKASDQFGCGTDVPGERHIRCKNSHDAMKLIKAALQMVNTASNLEFDWTQFKAKQDGSEVNTGDRAIGTLDGPCGKTSHMDFGKCQKPLECVGSTDFAPGKCKRKLPNKQRLEEAINLALDAADTASVFANQVRTAVSHIQVSITNNKSAMDALVNKDKNEPSYTQNEVDVSQETATAGTTIIAVTASAIAIFSVYALCIRGRGGSREKYQPI